MSVFTGIVEEVGTVTAVDRGRCSAVLTIRAETVLEDARVGDSIAVNGVCLTASSFPRPQVFAADVMPETFRRSNLGGLRPGDAVNLERALPADGRFGGHIVAGHIDGTGTVLRVRPEGNALLLSVSASPALLRYLVEKGSVAVDGASLTVVAVDASSFTVSLIPHTRSETTLSGFQPGRKVNLETDILAKYVEKLAQPSAGGVTRDLLQRSGFC